MSAQSQFPEYESIIYSYLCNLLDASFLSVEREIKMGTYYACDWSILAELLGVCDHHFKFYFINLPD